MNLLLRFLTVFVLLEVCYAYKFLVISPLWGASQTKFMGKLADLLTEAGHDVTVLIPVVDPAYKNKTGVKLTKKIEVYETTAEVTGAFEEQKEFTMKNIWNLPTNPASALFCSNALMKQMVPLCRKMVYDEDLITRLKAEKFDAGIGEPFSFCPLAFMNYLGIPSIIGATSIYQFDSVALGMGEPLAPSYVPYFSSHIGDKMNMLERLENAIGTFAWEHAFSRIFRAEQKIFEEKLGDFKSVEDVFGEMSVLFTNSNPLLNFPKPTLSKNIEIGGITAGTESHKLEKKWDDVLSLREHTVFVSFGSMAFSKDMPLEYRDSLISVMKSMSNITFIWKYEDKTDIVDHLPNVIMAPWLPQSDLLADSRLSLFITHGGLGSITEVAYSGTPVIMIPLFAEQPRNSAMLARHGGGILLPKSDLADAEKLQKTVETVVHDKSFKENAVKLAELLNAQPFTPKDQFIKHCEFAARFGRLPQMDPYGRHLSFIQYYFIDIISIGIILSAVTIYVTIALLRRICKKRKNKTE